MYAVIRARIAPGSILSVPKNVFIFDVVEIFDGAA